MAELAPGGRAGGVVLRAAREDDLPIFFAQQDDPVACALAGFPARERAAFMAHWARTLANPTIVARAILAGGRVAGNLVCFGPPEEREVGYWLGRDYWGRGIATAALAAFLGEYAERPLSAHVARHNAASRRVLERCGFVLVGEDDEEFTLTLGGRTAGRSLGSLNMG